jgi:UDP-N-acetylmuramyl pentapeptide phosphotransferase/UDP-N-acetylglucosamine-1-phosphate transferase
MMAFPMVGCLGGYLWHNAHPSAVLMGDAGSRPVGFLLGTLVVATEPRGKALSVLALYCRRQVP